MYVISITTGPVYNVYILWDIILSPVFFNMSKIFTQSNWYALRGIDQSIFKMLKNKWMRKKMKNLKGFKGATQIHWIWRIARVINIYLLKMHIQRNCTLWSAAACFVGEDMIAKSCSCSSRSPSEASIGIELHFCDLTPAHPAWCHRNGIEGESKRRLVTWSHMPDFGMEILLLTN